MGAVTTTPITVGKQVAVRKYGAVYPATVLHVTPTRVKIRFTTKAGRTKELFIPKADVVGLTPF